MMTTQLAGETQNWKRIGKNTMTVSPPTIINKPSVGTSTMKRTPSVTPTIKIISPNGGEVWHQGDSVTIKWSSSDMPKDTFIYIVLSGGDYEVDVGTTTNTGSYKWAVANNIKSTHCRIKIYAHLSDTVISAISAADFTVSLDNNG